MSGFPSRRHHAFATNGLLPIGGARSLRVASARCAGTTPTNRSGPQYPKAGTAGRSFRLGLDASHPSAPSEDDRKGKPGVNRGRKATGLGA